MPKMKTHKAGAKRYKVTATGKIVRNQAGRNHLNSKMNSKQKRRLDGPASVHETCMAKIKKELPYMKKKRK
jgi:large subunit ribosomal protein L35